MKNKNVFLSILAASILPAVCFTIISSIFDKSFLGWVVIIFPFVLLTTFLHIILFGFPLILLLRKINLFNLSAMSFLGFIVGGIPIPIGAILTTWFRGEDFDNWLNILKTISSFGMLGIVGGISFWVVFSHLGNDRK